MDSDYSFVVGPGKMDGEEKKGQNRAEVDTGLQTAISTYDSVLKGHSSDTDLSRPRDLETHLGKLINLSHKPKILLSRRRVLPTVLDLFCEILSFESNLPPILMCTCM